MDQAQVEALMYQFLGYLMVNYRANLIGLLQQDGWQIKSSDTDAKVRVTIVKAIQDSQPFREQLEELMYQAALLDFGNKNATGQTGASGSLQALIAKK